MKEMRSFNMNHSLLHKQNHVLVKFAISFLLVGLAFRLLLPNSFSFSTSVSETQKTYFPEDKIKPPVDGDSTTPPVFSENINQASENEKCDLSVGEWIPDPSGPVYTNKTCHVIQDHQNCMTNGRPDSGYLYWRWKPRDCELPRSNQERFLRFMRDKSLAFIGDSISRNHVQSLLCILSQVEQAVDVYHDKENRSRKWRFPTYNFTLSVVWAPFLLKAEIENSNGAPLSEIQVYLDELDSKWTQQYKGIDYAVIAGGKWYLKSAIYHENNAVVGCHYCPGKNLTELGYDYAYRKALRLVLNFLTTSDQKTSIIFRTITPDHFENGEWFSGGTCNRTVPFRESEIDIKDADAQMRTIELEEFEKAAAVALEKGLNLKLLDTTRLSMLRPDGHPGPYRHYHPFAENKNAKVQNDCLHWCLPGPIDSWNDIVMEILMNA